MSGGQAEARALFDTLRAGPARHVSLTRWEASLPGGRGTVSLRTVSRSGGPAVDITHPLSRVTRVHFVMP